MGVLNCLLLLSLLVGVGEKVGLTGVIATEEQRTFGSGHLGNNADYIQQLRNAVLPVTLTDFSLKASEHIVSVNWTTASEQNNSHFVLKRADDGADFKFLATVQGKGNSASITHYQYIDRQPLTGQNYYQLEQIDFDGTKALSKIIVASYELNQLKISTYFSEDGLLNTIIKAPQQNEPASITVYALNGRLLATTNVNLTNGSHHQVSDVFFEPGMYVISVGLKSRVISQKIIR